MSQLKQRVLILGATKGLGKFITEECLDRGWSTIEIGSSVSDEEKPDRLILHCDLASLQSVKDLLQKFESRQLDIDRFFWVAARFYRGSFALQDLHLVQEMAAINFAHPLLIAHWVWQQMHKAVSPKSFTVISSVAAEIHGEAQAVYAATKSAQLGFARCLGQENQNSQVQVSHFMPAGMKTPLWKDQYKAQLPPGLYDTFLDPAKVAAHIIDKILIQADPFYEETVLRGSL